MINFHSTILSLVILSIIIIVLFYLYMTRNFNYWKNQGVPFLKPIPVFGNILNICLGKSSIGDFCKRVYEGTTEPFMGVFLLDQPCLIVNDLELIKYILIKDFDYFMDRSMTTSKIHDPVGSSLLFTMKSPEWKDIRRKTTSLFSAHSTKLFSEGMRASARQMLEYVNQQITTEGNILEVRELCSKYSVNTISGTIFGLEGDCFKDENAPFRTIARRIFNFKLAWITIQTNCVFLAPAIAKLFRMTFVDSLATQFFRDIFRMCMKEREKNNFNTHDAISILGRLKKENKLGNIGEDMLMSQAAQFFIAGFESTAAVISCVLVEMAYNPQYQDKLRNEIISKKEMDFSYQSIQDMEYLNKVVLEALRKYPGLPFLDRRCNEDYTLPGTKITLRKGDIIYIPIYGIQHDEKYYPNPDHFDPDRFSKENDEKRNKMSFLTFGDGPRNCIASRYGMVNAKYAIAHLISRYEVKVCSRTEKRIELNSNGFLLQPTRGLYLEFVKLKENF